VAPLAASALYPPTDKRLTDVRSTERRRTEGTTMNITLWVIAGLLAAAFVAAGAMKLAQPKAKLAESGMA